MKLEHLRWRGNTDIRARQPLARECLNLRHLRPCWPAVLLLTLTSFLLGLMGATPAFAYYDVLDTARIQAKGRYKITGAAQILTQDTTGVNAEGSFEAGFQDEFGVRGLFGFGKTQYFVGGLFKWVPVPDVESQPAMGFNGGILYSRESSLQKAMTVRFEPLISKKFSAASTAWTPYVSLPLGIRTLSFDEGGSSTYMSAQLVFGSQLEVSKWKNLQFIGEVGVNLANAFSHLSLGALLYFDEEKGIVIE